MSLIQGVNRAGPVACGALICDISFPDCVHIQRQQSLLMEYKRRQEGPGTRLDEEDGHSI